MAVRQRTWVLLAVAACSPRYVVPARGATCPGTFHVGGLGPAALVPNGWGSDGEAPTVQIEKGRDGRMVAPMDSRSYFAESCTPGRYNRSEYVAWNLLDKTLRYTVDVSGAGCGCNAAFYLTSMRQSTGPSECHDYYCDANDVCGQSCAEIDIQEANRYSWHSTLHTAHDHGGVAGGYGGGGDGWNGPRDWKALDYAPGGNCIDTSQPFQVAVSFPIDDQGVLTAMEVTLTQEGHDCPLTTRLSGYEGLAELSKALAAGMTPILSYWRNEDMLWLDGRGDDQLGPCAEDVVEACGASIKLSNFTIEMMDGQPLTPDTVRVTQHEEEPRDTTQSRQPEEAPPEEAPPDTTQSRQPEEAPPATTQSSTTTTQSTLSDTTTTGTTTTYGVATEQEHLRPVVTTFDDRDRSTFTTTTARSRAEELAEASMEDATMIFGLGLKAEPQFPINNTDCPGSFYVEGHGPVHLVPTGWGSPDGGKAVMIKDAAQVIQMDSRAYFATSCTAGKYDHRQYLALELLGKRLRYTTDLSGAGCGCNAAFYLTAMRENERPSECHDYYCDANRVCGESCAEIDIQEANQFAWHSTLHTASDHNGVGGGYGGGPDWDGPRDWEKADFAPGSRCVDTNAPVHVVVEFPIDDNGLLAAMEVTLSQQGHSCTVNTRIDDYSGMVELTDALAAGMTPVVSYWSDDDMSWLDGIGEDKEGPCPRDSKAACSSSVKFYDFAVEDLETHGEERTTTVARQASDDESNKKREREAGELLPSPRADKDKAEAVDAVPDDKSASGYRLMQLAGMLRSSRCPGAIDVDGYGPVALVPSHWDARSQQSKIHVQQSHTVSAESGSRAYFANECHDGAYSRHDYLALNLLGKTIRYTTDVSAAGCGCTAAFYFTSMHQNRETSQCGGHYCDASGACGEPCAEIDIQEANQLAWRSTLHAPQDPLGASVATPLEYGPGAECIDTMAPFQVRVDFPVDRHGQLKAIQVVLSQQGHSCQLPVTLDSYSNLPELSEALLNGMTPIVSYKRSDKAVPCASDARPDCGGSVAFYNFSVDGSVTWPDAAQFPGSRSVPQRKDKAFLGKKDDRKRTEDELAESAQEKVAAAIAAIGNWHRGASEPVPGSGTLEAGTDDTAAAALALGADMELKGQRERGAAEALEEALAESGSEADSVDAIEAVLRQAQREQSPGVTAGGQVPPTGGGPSAREEEPERRSSGGKAPETFCCLAAVDARNACGTCHAGARMGEASYCGRSSANCRDCQANATFCGHDALPDNFIFKSLQRKGLLLETPAKHGWLAFVALAVSFLIATFGIQVRRWLRQPPRELASRLSSPASRLLGTYRELPLQNSSGLESPQDASPALQSARTQMCGEEALLDKSSGGLSAEAAWRS